MEIVWFVLMVVTFELAGMLNLVHKPVFGVPLYWLSVPVVLVAIGFHIALIERASREARLDEAKWWKWHRYEPEDILETRVSQVEEGHIR